MMVLQYLMFSRFLQTAKESATQFAEAATSVIKEVR